MAMLAQTADSQNFCPLHWSSGHLVDCVQSPIFSCVCQMNIISIPQTATILVSHGEHKAQAQSGMSAKWTGSLGSQDV